MAPAKWISVLFANFPCLYTSRLARRHHFDNVGNSSSNGAEQSRIEPIHDVDRVFSACLLPSFDFLFSTASIWLYSRARR